ncbi:lipopolysaccharide biosynthesis protein [Arthrobacter zhaoxinii]|uniref:lipopolysaccharide biosynthesis protein n=1 Tax=Arthrobacter zhaoxinii TaxID=2964616 RepID=UPI00210783FD|nr:hypothetical protein [Arthrobacter zhaoxinii]MCQ2001776.1 hypothetical protein [Arthrobacter zhaoxinii]
MGQVKNKIWYLAPTALTGLTSILCVPLLIYILGPAGWADLALGQAIGLFGTVFVSLGWPVTGPALIARSSADERYRQMVISLWTRFLMALPLVVIGAVALIYWIPQSQVLVCTALVSAFLGFAPSWYFLGIDDPKGLFWFDAVARATGTLGGLVGVYATHDARFYAFGLFCGIVVAATSGWAKARGMRAKVGVGVTASEVFKAFKGHLRGLTTNALYISIASVMLPLVALFGGPVYVVFAIVDKVQKQLLTVSLPITQMLTGRMAGDIEGGNGALAVASRSFKAIVVAGAILALCMIPITPWAVQLMSVGSADIDLVQILAVSLGVGLAFILQCLPVAVLVVLKRLGYAVVGMIVSLLIGIASVVFIGDELNLTFILWVQCGMYAVSIVFCWAGFHNAKRSFHSVSSVCS